MKKMSVLGSGQVGQVLADGLLKHGYEVMRASREPEKLADWRKAAGEHAHTGNFADAAKFADSLVLAVKGSAAENALELCGIANLAGKVILDATNPIADAAPDNGVLHFFTSLDDSLMERLQRKAPKARFVKAFSCVGNVHMIDPDFGSQKPTMFICGNDADAKHDVTELLSTLGWDTQDMGAVEAARAIEPLCILWCIPALTSGSFNHALKLLKK